MAPFLKVSRDACVSECLTGCLFSPSNCFHFFSFFGCTLLHVGSWFPNRGSYPRPAGEARSLNRGPPGDPQFSLSVPGKFHLLRKDCLPTPTSFYLRSKPPNLKDPGFQSQLYAVCGPSTGSCVSQRDYHRVRKEKSSRPRKDGLAAWIHSVCGKLPLIREKRGFNSRILEATFPFRCSK